MCFLYLILNNHISSHFEIQSYYSSLSTKIITVYPNTSLHAWEGEGQRFREPQMLI